VAQYTLDEMKAAVEAADVWGTGLMFAPARMKNQNTDIIKLMAAPENNFRVILKDGRVYKNTL
jgi:hypothetical protein